MNHEITNQYHIEFNPLPIKVKQPIDYSRVFSIINYSVSVNFYIYDKKRKTIVHYGSSKPCGLNNRRSSIHAEQLAIEYCLKHDKRNKYIIIITKFTKDGKHKTKKSCASCCQLILKYNFQNKIFTIDENNQIIPAISSKPQMCLAYKIKYGL
ncbi:MAG: hypothetical protein CMD29_05300 [Flavobacteriales bacterium]|nr:hypothetical protein [Flavobacteriales bacterium]|tara:strand:- start:622 stop:1080 length:459 start_codon:yes stop_codon:yes gene_type:complete